MLEMVSVPELVRPKVSVPLIAVSIVQRAPARTAVAPPWE